MSKIYIYNLVFFILIFLILCKKKTNIVCRKNYQHIEGSFLKAKLELHQAREKKDMLAEHLSIIISNNEDRKAERLSELMAKVGLPNFDDVGENIVE